MAIDVKYIISFNFFLILIWFTLRNNFIEFSLSLVVILFSFLFLLVYIVKPIKIKLRKKNLFIIILILLYIFLISTLSYVLNINFEYKRFLASYILFIYLIFTAFLISVYLKKIDSLHFYKVINSIFYLCVIDGIYTTIKYIFFNGSKQTIFFSEPSHFAIFFLPFFLFKLMNSQKQNFIASMLIIISVFLIAFFLQSLTLLIGSIIIMLILSKLRSIIFLFGIIVIILQLTNLEYFFSRITMSDNITNLSTLVFLSGWERAFLNMRETFGIGLGFNQLGYIGEEGVYAKTIYNIIGTQLNFNDGGTTAAKILSELGILGLAGLIAYLYFNLKIIFVIRKKNMLLNHKDMFFISVFLMYFMELFIRGVGYFSVTTFLFMISIFYIITYSNKKVELI